MNEAYALLTVIILAGLAGFYLWQRRSALGKSATGFHLATYAQDWTNEAITGRLDPVLNREEEIERVIHILLRRTKNNPLLLGEPGVGKTAVAEGLAQRLATGDVPEQLKGKHLLALDINSLIAETKYRGELENRLRSLTRELQQLARRVILFIDEIHMLEQIGRPEGSLSITDVFKPLLAHGTVQIIGATTWQEYEKYIRADLALDRRLQPVLVEEPSPEQALSMLRGLCPIYEQFHGVKITDEALVAAVRLSREKIIHRFLPDKAIDLIDEAGAKVAIEATRGFATHFGLVHAAARCKKKKGTVTVEDISEVVEEWVAHGKAVAKRL